MITNKSLSSLLRAAALPLRFTFYIRKVYKHLEIFLHPSWSKHDTVFPSNNPSEIDARWYDLTNHTIYIYWSFHRVRMQCTRWTTILPQNDSSSTKQILIFKWLLFTAIRGCRTTATRFNDLKYFHPSFTQTLMVVLFWTTPYEHASTFKFETNHTIYIYWPHSVYECNTTMRWTTIFHKTTLFFHVQITKWQIRALLQVAALFLEVYCWRRNGTHTQRHRDNFLVTVGVYGP
jgi:hypothetical protein